MKRTSIGRVLTLPTRWTSRFWSTRRSFACIVGGMLADLVEEHGPPGGRLEQAGLGLVGAGERALLVAEQLALEQALGERRAVDGDEAARSRAATGGGCSSRHHLLADAGLAQDDAR